jgi:hypothetical protein
LRYNKNIIGGYIKRNKKKNKITMLLLLLLGISIGFAALATTLKINGTANISKNTWNVYWDNIDNQDGVTPTTSQIVNEDDAHKKNIVNFEVTFEKPGDYYEFTVDAVNAGTIDAEILSIEKKYDGNVISQENPLPSYLKYEVTYEDGSEIKVGDKLAKRTDASTFTRKTYKIRVEYDKDAVTNSDVNNQVGDVTHTFDFKVEYGQSTSSDEDDSVVAIMREIEADPDGHRDPEQDPTNKDIAIDINGNVLNLNSWIGENVEGYIDKTYSIEYDPEEDDYYAVLGNCDGFIAPATASETIVNGKWVQPIPAYILFEEKNKFVPITTIKCLFADVYYEESHERTHPTELPNFPKTYVNMYSAFSNIGTFENLVIPKQYKSLEYDTFYGVFDTSNNNNTITFEEGSQMENIGDGSFGHNNLVGDITLPPSVKKIGDAAFTYNNLTSVSLPTTAEYYDNYDHPDYHRIMNSFDQNVTIIRY